MFLLEDKLRVNNAAVVAALMPPVTFAAVILDQTGAPLKIRSGPLSASFGNSYNSLPRSKAISAKNPHYRDYPWGRLLDA